MTTGATLYLVSACGSAEEFVAAFRRYADRTGLFIPSSAPLPAGRRGHLALTLRDGGVMIEGEAEILQSSAKPTVLHGRPGMTIKFIDADDLSKTVIGELEKARLAMKPAPPSVPPRPSEIPPEPRPVVPAVGGRIDAANALAECVVIGDLAQLVDTASAPRANESGKAKFVVPSIPSVGSPRSHTPSTPPPSRPNTPSTPPPVSGSSGVPTAIGAPQSGGTARPKTPSVPPDPASKPLPRPASKSIPPSTRMTSIGFPAVDKMPAFPPKTVVPGAPAATAAPARAPAAAAAAAPAENPLLQTKTGTPAPPNRTKEMLAEDNQLLQTQVGLGTPTTSRAPVSNATTLGMPALDKPRPEIAPRSESSSDSGTLGAARPTDKAPAARASSEHDDATAIGEAPPPKPPTVVEVNTADATTIGEVPPAPLAATAKKRTDPMPAATPASGPPTAKTATPSSGTPATPAPAPSGRAAMAVSDGMAPLSPSGAPRGAAAAPPSGATSPAAASGPATAGAPTAPRPSPASIAAAKAQRATSIGFPAVRSPFETQPVGVVRPPGSPSPPVIPGDGASSKTGAAPGPRGRNPTRPPMTPRHPTPVAPVPIVRPPAPRTAPYVEDAIVESAIVEEEKTDLSEVPVPPSRSGGPLAVADTVDAAVDPLANTQLLPQRSGGMRASEILAAIPTDDWTMSPDASGPTVIGAGANPPANPPAVANEPMPPPPARTLPPKGPPTGNWSISLDPDTGWSDPVKLEKDAAKPPEKAKAPKPRQPGSGNPDISVADEKGFTAQKWEEKPTGIGEAKIEIDSTLMEPLKPMPVLDDEDPANALSAPPAAGSAPRLQSAGDGNSGPRGIPPPLSPTYATPSAGMPAIPQGASPFAAQPPNPFAAPAGASPFAAPGAGPFPTPPSGLPAAGPYPTPAAGMQAAPGYSNPGLPVAHPGLFAGTSSQPIQNANAQFGMMGFPQADFSGAVAVTTSAAEKQRKKTIIIAIAAIAALAAGFVLVLVLAGGKDKKATTAKTGSGGKTGSAAVIEPGSNGSNEVTPANGSGSGAGSGTAEPALGSGSADEPAGSGSAVAAVVAVDAGVAEDKPPVAAGGPCKVSVTSVPNGADVYQGSGKLGRTPFSVDLPCGVETKLSVRKPKFINTTRSFTPADGKANKILVKLAKPTFTLKVTSSPAGATITVGGRSMGVTPGTIRLPAFEGSAVMVSKPGFQTDSKVVTPKLNNISHHVILKKKGRK